MRAITFKFFTTVCAMPVAMDSPSELNFSRAAKSFPSSSGSSTVISKSWWPRSRIKLRIRSSIVIPADGTKPGIDVTIP